MKSRTLSACLFMLLLPVFFGSVNLTIEPHPFATTAIAGHTVGSGAYCTCGYPGCVLDYCECGGPGCDNGRTANPKTKSDPKDGMIDFGSGILLALLLVFVISRMRN